MVSIVTETKIQVLSRILSDLRIAQAGLTVHLATCVIAGRKSHKNTIKFSAQKVPLSVPGHHERGSNGVEVCIVPVKQGPEVG